MTARSEFKMLAYPNLNLKCPSPFPARSFCILSNVLIYNDYVETDDQNVWCSVDIMYTGGCSP